MLKKFKNIFILSTLVIFIFLVSKYYFSENNIILTSKVRSSYLANDKNNDLKIPTLKNDTNNVIIYKNNLEDFKKKRKKRFWEKLISEKN